MRIYSLIVLLFITSYLRSERLPASVSEEKLSSASEYLLKRVAFKFSGTFKGIKDKGKSKEFRVTECNFSYEKGQEIEHTSGKEYKFERFNISYEGIDKKGVTSFDSVSYMNSNYLKDFKPFHFSNSFGPTTLNSVVKLGKQDQGSTIEFTRKFGKAASMTFKHSESFETGVSSFYNYGKRRNYTVTVDFEEFTDKIVLDKVSVLIESVNLDKCGEDENPIKIADIKCSQFKSLPDN